MGVPALAHRRLAVGLAWIGALAVLAVVGPWLVGDPLAIDIERGLSDAGAPLGPGLGPGGALLGTDALGRDVAARLVVGASTSLGIAATAALISLAVGLAVGLAAGYAGGRVDAVLMRLVTLVLAFPVLLLAVLLAALLRESRLAGTAVPVIATLAAVGWTPIARVVRDKVRVLARGEMVLAARAAGAGPVRVAARHLWPNVAGLAVVLAALGLAQNLLAEAVLSYLGLGAPPPTPTWGRMLFEGRAYYRVAPLLVIAPAVAILVSVAGFHVLAAGLRDAFDPRRPRGARR